MCCIFAVRRFMWHWLCSKIIQREHVSLDVPGMYGMYIGRYNNLHGHLTRL
jgi:hypothetical protein